MAARRFWPGVGRQVRVRGPVVACPLAVSAAEQRVQANPDVLPPSWTRYLVEPVVVEFRQASHDRRHVRLRYRRDGAGWVTERLWP